MITVLLADDSAHALRMGETILREEGFEVRTAVDASAVLTAMAQRIPDVVLLDAFLPGASGFDLCRRLKGETRVILTAGLLEPLDEAAAASACDAVLRKPLEASVAAALIRKLAAAVDPGQVRAEVEKALQEALPALVHDITEKVLAALRRRR